MSDLKHSGESARGYFCCTFLRLFGSRSNSINFLLIDAFLGPTPARFFESANM